LPALIGHAFDGCVDKVPMRWISFEDLLSKPLNQIAFVAQNVTSSTGSPVFDQPATAMICSVT
jgi:hypothetical protein